METFKYTKLAAESGKDGLIALAIVGVIAIFVIYKFSARPEGLFSKSGMIILAGLGLFAVIAVNSVMARLQSSGAWEITINEQQLQWLGPQGIDTSFTLNLSDIQSLRITSADNDNFTDYLLVLQNGEDIQLSEESGLDFDEFAKALEDRGVQVEQIEVRPSQ